MTTLSRLNQYGNAFQVKVLGALLTQRDFLLNIADSLDSEYFESQAHKWVIDYIIKYFGQYHTYPTIETLSIEIKKIDNEVLRISLTDALREAYKMSDVSDLEWVEEEFSSFCKNQQMKKAIMTSVDLLNLGDYDGIRSLINMAMKAGEEKNIGHLYEADVEARYRDDDRNAIPFPWKTFNELTQGGYGKGDLVLVFGNPGGGKSWGVIAMGAYAAALGYNVVHYTLELSEGYVGKRYDAVFSGVDVDKLNDHRSEVEEAISKVKGKIVIKEYAPKRASLDTIEAHLQQLEHQNEFKPDLIIIDYLDLLRTKGRKERKDEIDDVYTEAKGLAKQLCIPIVSPSQANRTGADKDILQAENAAGSYDKIMIGDIIISLARGRKDKVNGTGNWHFIKNRYGADGLTFGSRINTANGFIDIFNQPLDDEEFETKAKGNNKQTNPFSDIGEEDKYILRSKFAKYEEGT
jgi:replicative DNA helicase